jgi:hypothetical protein
MDYVNKGTQSLTTIQLVREQKKNLHLLQLIMLNIYSILLRCGNKQ